MSRWHCSCPSLLVLISTLCPKKLSHFYFLNNSVKDKPILIIFGTLNREGTWYQKVASLPTSPAYCSYCTWGMSKSHFTAAACWDVGWTAAERRGWGHWPMAETTGSVCPCTEWSLWTLSVALLPFILPHNTTGFFRVTHFLRGKQRTFELMNYFIFSKVLRNVFSGEVGKLTIFRRQVPSGCCIPKIIKID